MSRLTLPHYGGKGHYMRCSEQFGCSGECADCEELDKIIEKLAEYEDKEERKTGHWITHNKGKDNWCECPECHTVGSPQWKSCPVCDTKMVLSDESH